MSSKYSCLGSSSSSCSCYNITFTIVVSLSLSLSRGPPAGALLNFSLNVQDITITIIVSLSLGLSKSLNYSNSFKTAPIVIWSLFENERIDCNIISFQSGSCSYSYSCTYVIVSLSLSLCRRPPAGALLKFFVNKLNRSFVRSCILVY